MKSSRQDEILFWRRTDIPGLERLCLRVSARAVTARSNLICLEGKGFQIDYRWTLTSDWRTRSLAVKKRGPKRDTRLLLERVGAGWAVNISHRQDLNAAATEIAAHRRIDAPTEAVSPVQRRPRPRAH